ncbi:MAG: helix-turn-helix transcriptional regulator [Prevotella sp.]|uniref:helix-turn-helix domain-containing protein n=1 Tax=Prevotella sp. AGR2160 TaxID=1280674 RepID=UPI001E362AF3|nr:helix-turn-helix transcriptional regulator [Prevotella sp. AGR2160]MDD5861765.1 helix-turn-helix transcriptional regulator [Prevotella sp.]
MIYRQKQALIHLIALFKFDRMTDYYEYSIPELVRMLGSRFRDYRMRSDMTQKDVADQAGLTVNTVHKFENGLSPNLSLSTFLLLLKAIGCIDGLDELMPELPESAYLTRDSGRKVQRIRHTKK